MKALSEGVKMDFLPKTVLLSQKSALSWQVYSHLISSLGATAVAPPPGPINLHAARPRAEAAILDPDIENTPEIARQLHEQQVSVVFCRGTVHTRISLPPTLRRIPIFIVAPYFVPGRGVRAGNDDHEFDVDGSLPYLRAVARILYTEPTVADRFVERVLLCAIANVRHHDGQPLLDRLVFALRKTLDDEGTSVMQ